MRALPDTQAPEVKLAPSDRVCLKLKYSLMTPLFGGGARPKEPDPITVVRPSSVVGHLRFWWRACRAEAFPDLAAMRQKEDEIWGSTSLPSRVQLHVRVLNPGRKVEPYSKGPENRARAEESVSPSYVSFPAQPEKLRFKPGQDPVKFLEGVEFELELMFPPALQAEVEAAVWAWSQLGGVGARTRRGFGALRLDLRNGQAVKHPSAGDFQKALMEGFQTHVGRGGDPVKGVPRLRSKFEPASELAFTGILRDASFAWKRLISSYREFRQNRRRGERTPGRSFWPEPDAIRILTSRHSQGHAPLPGAVVSFPRSWFGLPIIFHFKDQSDPPDTTLESSKGDRWASPLILRPVACAEGAIGIALLLTPNGRGQIDPTKSLKLREHDVKASIEDMKKVPMLEGVDPYSAFFKRVKEVRS